MSQVKAFIGAGCAPSVDLSRAVASARDHYRGSRRVRADWLNWTVVAGPLERVHEAGIARFLRHSHVLVSGEEVVEALHRTRGGVIVVGSAGEVAGQERVLDRVFPHGPWRVCLGAVVVVVRKLVVSRGVGDEEGVEVVFAGRVDDIDDPATRVGAAGRERNGFNLHTRRLDLELCCCRWRDPPGHARVDRHVLFTEGASEQHSLRLRLRGADCVGEVAR
eukprot:3931644-Rhodomonas_salina.2